MSADRHAHTIQSEYFARNIDAAGAAGGPRGDDLSMVFPGFACVGGGFS